MAIFTRTKKARSYSDFPKLVAAQQKLDELKGKAAAAEIQVATLKQFLGPVSPEILVEAAALADVDAAQYEQLVQQSNEFRAAERSHEVLTQAVKMHMPLWEREKAAADKEMTADVVREQKVIAKRVVKLIHELEDALTEERELRESCGADVVHDSQFPTVQIPLFTDCAQGYAEFEERIRHAGLLA